MNPGPRGRAVTPAGWLVSGRHWRRARPDRCSNWVRRRPPPCFAGG